MNIRKLMICLPIFVFLHCGTMQTVTWNPNSQPKEKLAFLKLVNNSSGSMDASAFNWHIVGADGVRFPNPWIPGKDYVAISTEKHSLSLAPIIGSRNGKPNYQDQDINLDITGLLDPEAEYKLITEKGSMFDGPYTAVIRLEQPPGWIWEFKDTTVHKWKLKMVKDGDGLVSAVKWELVKE